MAIVDYGFGNLRSVARACEHVGMQSRITSDPEAVERADGVILPGIGAFGDAMDALRRLGLVDVLRHVASERPLMGVCLGAQLLQQESAEFGCHEGLGILDGAVAELPRRTPSGARIKVPHVGWTAIDPVRSWNDTMLAGVHPGDSLYFTHSFYLVPADPSIVLSTSVYGDVSFCSSYQRANVFGCQSHPERSGASGLQIYRNLKRACRHDCPADVSEVIDAN